MAPRNDHTNDTLQCQVRRSDETDIDDRDPLLHQPGQRVSDRFDRPARSQATINVRGVEL
jgi:hypothetical protein